MTQRTNFLDGFMPVAASSPALSAAAMLSSGYSCPDAEKAA